MKPKIDPRKTFCCEECYNLVPIKFLCTYAGDEVCTDCFHRLVKSINYERQREAHERQTPAD